MAVQSFAHRGLKKLKGWLGPKMADRSGISAVEFALVAPIMITMLLATTETVDFVSLDRKVTSVTSSVGDLIAQSESLSNSDVTNIFNAAAAIMLPYDTTNLEIIVTSVRLDSSNDVEIVWSDALNTQPYNLDETLTLPTGILLDGTSLIVVEVAYRHDSGLNYLFKGALDIEDTFYLRPRLSVEVERTT